MMGMRYYLFILVSSSYIRDTRIIVDIFYLQSSECMYGSPHYTITRWCRNHVWSHVHLRQQEWMGNLSLPLTLTTLKVQIQGRTAWLKSTKSSSCHCNRCLKLGYICQKGEILCFMSWFGRTSHRSEPYWILW